METWLFYFFGGVALIAAINVVARQKIIYSALSLIVCLCALSGTYMLLQAPFIAALQVIVYAGAIMVLFLFVIMMLDPFSPPLAQDRRRYLRYLALILGALSLTLLYPLLRSYDPARAPWSAGIAPAAVGTVRHIGEVLFKEYLLPFEITSVLILIAIIGAVVLAKRQV
jgi:NADH-quinone oxidoreductase subunit J